MMVKICKEQFDNFLKQFISISKETSEPWEILQAPSPNDEYIYGSRVISKVYESVVEESTNCENDLDEKDFSLNEADDPHAVSIPPTNQRIVTFQYHIIFNESYSVPVLYFQASHANGSLLKLEEIWKLIPSIYITDSVNSEQEQFEYLLSIISPTEHPYLGTPVYHMHPCQVSTLLINAFQSKSPQEQIEFFEKQFNAILTWLSSVGPLIGLKLDNYYAVTLEKINSDKKIN